jgi:thiol-disulfide isomerase/thioredoxin
MAFSTRAVATVVLSLSVAAVGGCGGGPKKPANSATSSDGKSGPAEVGKPAPELSVDTVNGKGKVSLESLQGKVAVVDFWATWCAPCKQSFPKLEELSKQNPDKLQIVGIAVDDQVDGVADFAKQNGATFAIAWDNGHSIANRWKVDTMPTTYVLDATGTVRYIHAGYHDDEAEKIAKEVATLSSEAGGSSSSKIAKTDSTDTKPDAKGDGKGDAKGDGKSDASTPPPSGDGDGDGDAAPAKKPPKKPGKGGGKKPPAKKPPKKK